MHELSYPNHVVPKLSVDDVFLSEGTIANIQQEQLARPGNFVAKTYWDVVETLGDMLDILEASFPTFQERDKKHRSLLRQAEILMLRCMSLHDYLGRLLTICAPADAGNELKQCRRAITAQLERNIKVPINKTKHDGFTLAPIVLTNGVASVPGFVVYGPLQDGVSGPLSFSTKHGAGTPEGFSLPLFMRQVLANIFVVSDLARDQLVKWGAVDPSRDASKAHNPNLVHMEFLQEVLARLNVQPFHGFGGEHMTRSPVFLVEEGTLKVQWARTKRMRGKVTVNFQIPAVPEGGKVQMPYWGNSR